MPIIMHKILPQCQGCDAVDGRNYCRKYADPSVYWNRGHCPAASHKMLVTKSVKEKVRVGQQKQKNVGQQKQKRRNP